MAKLRKMLGDVNSEECRVLMNLIETQNVKTLSSWALDVIKGQTLEIVEACYPGNLRLNNVIQACEEYNAGTRTPKDLKPLLKEASQVARESSESPAGQAAARAIAAACAVPQTPTNALGFLFYHAAAVVYHQHGQGISAEKADAMALEIFREAAAALRKRAVEDEPNPVKIQWHC